MKVDKDGVSPGDGNVVRPDGCDASSVTGCVEASEWAREMSDIGRFCFDKKIDEPVTEVSVESEDGTKLGKLELDQVTAENDKAAPGTILTEFDPAEGKPVKLRTKGTSVDDGYRVDMTLERADTQVGIRAVFTTGECYERRPPSGDRGPPCTWPVSIGESELSVPSCGAIVSRLEDAGFPPNLHMLQYRKPDTIPEGIGGVETTKNGKVSTMTAYLGAEITDENRIEEWLSKTGADELIGTQAEQLLTISYLEQAWRKEVKEAELQCSESVSEDAESTREQSLSCRKLGLSNQSTRRQASSGCGGNWLGGGGGTEGAWGGGDPHFRTYDGTAYNFQAAGEFVLARKDSGPAFEIQARMEPISACREAKPCNDVSFITAAALKVGDHRIAVHPERDKIYWLDGEPVESGWVLANKELSGVKISFTSTESLIIEGAEGEWIEINRFPAAGDAGILSIQSKLPDDLKGRVEGLFGYYNDTPDDDFRNRDGKIYEAPLNFETMYGEFGNDWRIDASRSLFEYEEGKSTFSYTNRQFPEDPARISDLPEEARQEARKKCEGIEARPARQWCILDTACTCNEKVGRSNATANDIENEQIARKGVSFELFGNMCNERPESLEHSPVDETAPKCTRPPRKECVRFYEERRFVELSSDLNLDIRQPGRYESESELDSGTVSSGTAVSSFIIHLQELPETSEKLEAHVVTSHDILGAIVNPSTFDNATGVLGEQGRTYPDSPQSRGIDWEQDWIELDGNRKRLSVNLVEKEDIDMLRVITKAPKRSDE